MNPSTRRREQLPAINRNAARDQSELPPAIIGIRIEEFTREFNRMRIAEGGRIEHAKTDLVGIERRLRKIVDAIAEGVPARTLKEELLALEARQDELRGLL